MLYRYRQVPITYKYLAALFHFIVNNLLSNKSLLMSYPIRGSRPTNSTNEKENSDDDDVRVGLIALTLWASEEFFGSSEPQSNRQVQKKLSSLSSSCGMRDQTRNQNNNTSGNIIPSSSRGIRDQNRNENNNTSGHIRLESRRKNSGKGIDKWTRPKEGRFKLNTDASVRKQHGHKTGPATAGGVIRNDAGQWIVGFTLNLEECDSTHAELLAVRKGLFLAWKRGFRELDVETDSEAAVILIKKTDLKYDHPMRLVVEDCRNVLVALDSEIGHVYKEGNKCAHALAKVEIHPNKRKEVWEHIPNDQIFHIVESDMKLSLKSEIVFDYGYCPTCDTCTDECECPFIPHYVIG